MKKKLISQWPVIFFLLILLIACTVMMFFVNRQLFWVQIAILAIAAFVILLRSFFVQRDIHKFLEYMGRTLSSAQQESLMRFPMPVMVANAKREIIWYNDKFRSEVLDFEDLYGRNEEEVFGELEAGNNSREGVSEIEYQNRKYTVFSTLQAPHGEALHISYFVENTELKKYYKEYFLSRPVVVIFMLDNYEELLQNASESEKSTIIGEIEYMIEKTVFQTNGFIKKIERDKFIAVIEDRYMDEMIRSRFEILDKVRTVISGGKMPATLSIGVGRGASNLLESEHMARQALDMCLGRGGDQAAVKTVNGFDFYGGVSKGIEKRTKVKTRIVASALSELIEASDNVIIMGHRFGDLDSIGSAVGLAKAVRQMGRMSYIAVDKERNLAKSLIELIEKNGGKDYFCDPDIAAQYVTKKTLLIIVDTHTRPMLESPSLYADCKTVVVIDHHRKMVNHIDNAVIFYHEPYASSASEMVAELVQYLGDRHCITKVEAESLLAGIMLDTKNFVLKTGVRTFEAAAYLRKLGADTVEVRKLFSNSMASYQRKIKLVASAEVYRKCAIASNPDSDSSDIRIVTAQAADELLGITNVDASFVMFEQDNVVHISGRSMGNINVQLILETLGGGGHLTMAGAQIQSSDIESARQALLAAIDKYYEQQNLR